MSRPFDDRGVVGEVGGVVEFIGTTEQFRVEYLGRLYDSQRIAVDRVRSVGCELPQGIDGFDDRNGRPVGRRSTAFKIKSDDTSGRTPSWTAISATVRGSADRPLRTEWNRCGPPAVQVCLAMSKRAARFFQKSICPSGRTTTICVLCSVLAKAFIAWPNTGSDPSMRNCLGSGPPRRLPLPPATMITPVPCCSISVSFRIRGYCP